MSRPGRIVAIGSVFLVGVAVAFALFRQHPPRAGLSASSGKIEISSLLLRPTSAFFGETISADASVVAAGVDAERVALRPDFRPYSVVATTRSQHTAPGGRTMLRLHWTLQCLRTRCLAADGQHAVYTFPLSVTAGGGGRVTDTALFPPLLVVSRLATGGTRMRNEVALDERRPSSGPNAAVVSVGAIGLVGAAALLLLAPARRRASGRASVAPDPLRDAIERAEGRRVAVSLAEQRGALDHLARAVADADPALAHDLRGVAWGETQPDDASIGRLLDRARRLLR